MIRRPLMLTAVGTALAVVAVLVLWSRLASAPEVPPLPDLAGMEPQVIDKVRRTHAALEDARDAAAFSAYARVLHAHGMFDAAAPVYLAAAGLRGDDAFNDTYLAACALENVDRERAVVLLEAALALRKDYLPALLRTAEMLERLGRLAEARTRYEAAQWLSPTKYALLGLGRIALQEDRADAARDLLERARTDDPRYREVREALSRCYMRLGRRADAQRESDAAGDLRHPTTYPDAILLDMIKEGVGFINQERLTKAYITARDWANALPHARRALELRPDSWDDRYTVLSILINLDRHAEALTEGRALLTVRPDDARVLNILGNALNKTGRPDEALAMLERAVRADPSHSGAHQNKAAVLFRLGRKTEARTEAERLVQQFPRDIEARILLASITANLGDRAAALAALDEVLRLEPEHSQALTMRATLTTAK